MFDENTEWQLFLCYFAEISEIFGLSDIDLFASRLNNHCPLYCSWKPDPTAKFMSAFTVNWNNFERPYLFPLFSIIGKCLQKICSDQANAIFIAPLWPTQFWYPKLMSMFTDVPIVLPVGVLRLPFKPCLPHKQHRTLRLIACRLSGNCMLHEEFLKNLPISSVPPGEIPRNPNIQFMLNNGYISVSNGKSIPFSMMK